MMAAARLPSAASTYALARRVAHGLFVHDAFRAAAAVAFWLFLSLVPLLVLVGFLVGQVARRHGVESLAEPLLQVVPSTAEDLVHEEIGRLASSRATLAPIGALAYLWAASSGVHNLLDTFERARSASARPYWKKRALSLAWVAAGLAAACAVALLLVRVGELSRDSSTHLRGSDGPAESSAGRSASHGMHIHATPAATNGPAPHPHRAPRTPLESATGAAVCLVAGASFLAAFLRFGVRRPRGARRRVWPGTLAAIGCWLLVSWAFGLYAASIANYALFYGSLAAVAVLLIWLYLTSLSLMVGVELNAHLEDRGGAVADADTDVASLLAS